MTTFSYTSGDPTHIVGGQTANLADISGSFADIATYINGGNIDAANLASGAVDVAELASTLAAFLGVTQSGTVRRGKSIIATEETRTSSSFGLMTTPDRVSNVVLPTDGLIFVSYVAQIKCSVGSVTSASVFIGGNQIKAASTAAAPAVVGISAGSGPQVLTSYNPMTTHPVLGMIVSSGVAYSGDVTTGQSVSLFSAAGDGGPFWAGFAAAGTYDVTVQTKSTSGTVSMKNRNLWVWTMGF